MKRPAIQFYVGDWLRDARLRACSVGARGLWVDLMCLMHDLEPYGHLAIDGVPIDDATAAGMCGLTPSVYRRLLAELEAKGVSSRSGNGVLYSRRMDKDGKISEERAIAGAKGQQALRQTRKQTPRQTVADADAVSRNTPKGVPKGEVPDGFAEAWATYPRRTDDSKAKAAKAYRARLAEGIEPAVLLAGVQRYAARCRREQTEPRYIKMAATFFGPDRHWESDYSPPADEVIRVYDERGELTPEAAAILR